MVNLDTPKKPNEVDVRAEKGEVILSNKHTDSDNTLAASYLAEDGISTVDESETRAMLEAFLNKPDRLGNLMASMSLNSNMNSYIANIMPPMNMIPVSSNKYERITEIGGDTVNNTFENKIIVQGDVDKDTWPGMNKAFKTFEKKLYDNMERRRVAGGAR